MEPVLANVGCGVSRLLGIGVGFGPGADADSVDGDAEQVGGDEAELAGSQADEADYEAVNAGDEQAGPALAADEDSRENCKTAGQIIQAQHGSVPAFREPDSNVQQSERFFGDLAHL